MKPRIGVLTSGGDCPGLNAVLRGVVLAADKLGWDVVGFRDGFEGLLPPGNHVILDRKSIDGIMALGGTIIGTTNRGHFVAKTGAGDRTVVPAHVIEDAKKILGELQVKALIIVGGDGSLVTAQQLQEAGINCIGVPKTIDNDLEATATTFSSIPPLMSWSTGSTGCTTATSHRRVVVEVWDHAGWIAAWRYRRGADITIPEIPFDYDKIAGVIKAREAAVVWARSWLWRKARPKHGEQVKRDVRQVISAWRDWRRRAKGEACGKSALLRASHLQRRRTNDIGSILATGLELRRAIGKRRALRFNGELPQLPGAPRADCRSGQSPQTGPAQRRNCPDRA